MNRTPEPSTTYLCGQHNRLAAPVWYEGEKRMRHTARGDKDWCFSARFTQREVREVDRETVLAGLAGETGKPLRPGGIGKEG